MRKVFISYSSKDESEAQLICRTIESVDCKCWIASRDIDPGAIYPEEIIKGIEECPVYLLLLSAQSLASDHVFRELERAGSKSKHILTVKLEPVQLTKRFEYYLQASQWINASDSFNAALLNKLAKSAANLAATPTSSSSVEAASLKKDSFHVAADLKTDDVRFEVSSKTELNAFKEEDRLKIPDILNHFNAAAPGTGLALVGMEMSPLIVQFSATMAGFEKLQRLFLTRKLFGQKEFQWNSLKLLSAATAAKPWQAAFCYKSDKPIPEDLTSVVCHLEYIGGFHALGRHARGLVGENTTDLEQCKIYILFSSKGGIYAHSNFIKEGSGFPTKLCISHHFPIFDVFQNLVSYEAQAGGAAMQEKLERIHANHVHYIVAEDNLPDDIVELFCGAKNIDFVPFPEVVRDPE